MPSRDVTLPIGITFRALRLIPEGPQALLSLLARATLGDSALRGEPVGALEDELLGMARGFGACAAELVESFLEMALTVNRYENYLDTVDVKALERDRERWHQRASAQDSSDAERSIAQKNFAVIQKRVERVHEITRYLGVARAQLDLIENSFLLIADQLVTMQSPNELSGQLDDLLDGVDSIRQTTIDTEKLLGTMETA